MFELQQPDPLSYLKQLSPTHRFGKVTEATIDCLHPNPQLLDQDAVKVLSWNIAKNNHSPNWRTDFLAIVERHQPDKIFLQEVRLGAIERQIPELESMGWIFAPNLIDSLDNTYSGVLTATRYHPLTSHAKITRDREPVTKTPKVSLFVEYSWNGGRPSLLTVNTHLINFVETSKFQAQLQEIKAIIARHRGAVILSGDFNTWNRSRWLLLLEMTASLGLQPVTFPKIEAQKLKRFMLSPPLDYIFYRGFRQKTATAKVIDRHSSSDHNPLVVELCI